MPHVSWMAILRSTKCRNDNRLYGRLGHKPSCHSPDHMVRVTAATDTPAATLAAAVHRSAMTLTLQRSVNIFTQLPEPSLDLQRAVALDIAPLHSVEVMPLVQPLMMVSTRPACASAMGAITRHTQIATAMTDLILLLGCGRCNKEQASDSGSGSVQEGGVGERQGPLQ